MLSDRSLSYRKARALRPRFERTSFASDDLTFAPVPLTCRTSHTLRAMCDPVSATIMAVGSLGGALVAGSQQKKALRAQQAAERENIAAQEKTRANAQKAEANRTRTPNFNAMFDRNTIASGVSSTMLTGAGGVSNGLSLARNSLLGG